MKLIRDKLSPSRVSLRLAHDDAELLTLTRRKLLEEAAELVLTEPGADTLDELADVLECVRALGELHGFDLTRIAEAADRKHRLKGGFDGGRVLEVR